MSSASFRKEPSMDEILASIRRIIESSEDRPGQAGAHGQADAEERGGAARPEAATVPAELSSGSPMPRFDVHYLATPPREDRPSREADSDDAHDVREASRRANEFDAEAWGLRPAADSIADGDRRRGGFDRSEVSFEREPVAAALQAENQNALAEDEPAMRRDEARDFAFEFDDAALEEALRNSEWHQPPAASEPMQILAEPSPALPPAGDLEPETLPVAMPAIAAHHPVERVPAQMPESVIAGASALLSAQAGDQVAAAFDDLTLAIREGHMHSMEGMARDLLRPMLQEWLDENLPRIVERLVRDEIERVARGPRR